MKTILAIAVAAFLSGCVGTGNSRGYMATSFETVNYGVIGYGTPGSFW